MRYLEPGDGESGEAADTGSAVHRGVEAMLKDRKEVATCIQIMEAERHQYPLANLQEAAGLFLKIAANPPQGEVVLCEQEIRFEIACDETDKTGQAIVVEGTVDLVMRYGGILKMWDTKTSVRQPVDILRETMHQAACYCIGASILLNEQVNPGGIIMPRQNHMHIPFTWKFQDIEYILAPLRRTVAAIRNGAVDFVAGADNCKWCHAGGPDLCIPKKRRMGLL